MDSMHSWALWRLLLMALIALPLLIAVVIAGLRQPHDRNSKAKAEHHAGSAGPAISGPGAWSTEAHGSVEIHRVTDKGVLQQRAA
jgi:hypothetical protein